MGFDPIVVLEQLNLRCPMLLYVLYTDRTLNLMSEKQLEEQFVAGQLDFDWFSKPVP